MATVIEYIFGLLVKKSTVGMAMSIAFVWYAYFCGFTKLLLIGIKNRIKALLATVLVLLFAFFAMGRSISHSGLQLLSEFGIMRFYPVLSLICMIFAEFMVILFNYNFQSAGILRSKVYFLVDCETPKLPRRVSTFEQPSMVCLQ